MTRRPWSRRFLRWFRFRWTPSRELRESPPLPLHPPGMEFRIMVEGGVLYQANCEQARISAIYGGERGDEGWVSLLNSSNMKFAYPVDVQMRALAGVRGVYEIKEPDY